MTVFTEPELRRIAELDGDASQELAASEPPRARCIMPRDADERFSSVEVYERRGGRLHRRGEGAE